MTVVVRWWYDHGGYGKDGPARGTGVVVVVVVAAPATVPGPVIMVVPMVVVDDDVVAWSRVGPRGPVKENPVGVVEFPQFIRRCPTQRHLPTR